ncbi:EAL domain-containing protein (putative c-di-GMP-specific phosphodiesterase class I) [Fictibacillus halophilus]|uniref:EAL domain-containing protein (Putative c-di-GMP-specific phosphodiesterase class I) n=1 Tax=Fictibacillus halophilus TaxID=1610490 RepID=A0ABV2LI14_9BACL|nr:EAL domain-containing protein [Fictibacillus halophilus]
MIKELYKPVFYLKYLIDQQMNLYFHSKKYLQLLNLIDEKQILTYFQPILCLRTGKTIGFEILNRPLSTKALKNVEAFYDFIGKSGHLFWIEKFLRKISLKRHFHQVKKKPEFRDQMIFINIMPQVLSDPSYRTGDTIELLNLYGFSPEQIVLELTEKEAVTDYDQFIKAIEHYKKQGFRLAVDDTGSGYNSLKTLIKLKPDFIKLDKSLIRGIHKEDSQKYLVELLLDYARSSGTQVIAEGIETQKELSMLQQLSVDFGQGYHLGKPEQELFSGTMT